MLHTHGMTVYTIGCDDEMFSKSIDWIINNDYHILSACDGHKVVIALQGEDEKRFCQALDIDYHDWLEDERARTILKYKTQEIIQEQ